MREIGQNVLGHLFIGYLKLLNKTVTIQWAENSISGGSQIFGFWHEDSFFMNMILSEISKQTSPVDVIVTADKRGDYIQNMIERSGGRTVLPASGRSK